MLESKKADTRRLNLLHLEISQMEQTVYLVTVRTGRETFLKMRSQMVGWCGKYQSMFQWTYLSDMQTVLYLHTFKRYTAW